MISLAHELFMSEHYPVTLIRLVEVANVETIYHHELLEYSFSKKNNGKFQKSGCGFHKTIPCTVKTHLSSVLS